MPSSPVHPFDRILGLQKWSRATLDDLSDSSEKVALRLICRTLNLSPAGNRTVLAVIDIHAWLASDKVHYQLASSEQGSLPQLSQLVASGLNGVTPLAVGLTPCRHSIQHWNPLCLPLVWQVSMGDMRRFNLLMPHYIKLLHEAAWQCPDMAQLIE